MTADNRPESKKDVTYGTGIGLAIGVGVGVAFGLIIDNLALGIALGAAFGLIFGFTIPSTRKSKNKSMKTKPAYAKMIPSLSVVVFQRRRFQMSLFFSTEFLCPHTFFTSPSLSR